MPGSASKVPSRIAISSPSGQSPPKRLDPHTEQNALPRGLLHAEGLTIAVAATALYFRADYPWWLFAALVLAPDLSMVGYLAGRTIGAAGYKAAHTYSLPAAVAAIGVLTHSHIAINSV